MTDLNLDLNHHKESVYIDEARKTAIVSIGQTDVELVVNNIKQAWKIHVTPVNRELPPNEWYSCVAGDPDEAMWAVLQALDCHITKPPVVYQMLQEHFVVSTVNRVELKWGD